MSSKIALLPDHLLDSILYSPCPLNICDFINRNLLLLCFPHLTLGRCTIPTPSVSLTLTATATCPGPVLFEAAMNGTTIHIGDSVCGLQCGPKQKGGWWHHKALPGGSLGGSERYLGSSQRGRYKIRPWIGEAGGVIHESP